jgi:hypothetical protein
VHFGRDIKTKNTKWRSTFGSGNGRGRVGGFVRDGTIVEQQRSVSSAQKLEKFIS